MNYPKGWIHESLDRLLMVPEMSKLRSQTPCSLLIVSTTRPPSHPACALRSLVSSPPPFSSYISPLHPRYSSNPSTNARPSANLHLVTCSPSPLSSSPSCNRRTIGWCQPKGCSGMSTMVVALAVPSVLPPARHSCHRMTSALCNRPSSSWSPRDHTGGVPRPSRTSSLVLEVGNSTRVALARGCSMSVEGSEMRTGPWSVLSRLSVEGGVQTVLLSSELVLDGARY